ncbi:MAG: hypothetical protein AMXMBFR84_21440 [Candidatus Hydrogenedentota bacterium]
MKRCYNCGEPWESVQKQPAPKDFCAKCDAYLRCCRNCRFFDPTVSKQCQIPNVELVTGKEAGNFCDEFDFANSDSAPADSQAKDTARTALDSLFGDVPSDGPDAKLDRFRGLFGD